MIDRAVCAGIAIGVGAVMLLSQLFADTPQYGAIAVGLVLIVVGAIFWSDLREESFGEGTYDHHEEGQ